MMDPPGGGLSGGGFERTRLLTSPRSRARSEPAGEARRGFVVNYVHPYGNKIELDWIMTSVEERDLEVIMVQDGTLPYY